MGAAAAEAQPQEQQPCGVAATEAAAIDAAAAGAADLGAETRRTYAIFHLLFMWMYIL
jgi:hypothetical protein